MSCLSPVPAHPKTAQLRLHPPLSLPSGFLMQASTIYRFPGRTLLPWNPVEALMGGSVLPFLLAPLEEAPPHNFQQLYPQDKSLGSLPRHAVPIKFAST